MSREVTTNERNVAAAGCAMIACLITCFTVPASAAVVTFKDGSATPIVGGTYTGTQDAAILSGSATLSAGGNIFLWAGKFDSDTRRTVMRFDVSALAGQYGLINSVTLRLFPETMTDYTSDSPATNTLQVFELTPANQSWTEGTLSFGPPATGGQVTWNHRNATTTAWAGSAGASTAGTDYINTLLASATYSPSTPLATPLAGGLSLSGGTAYLTGLINNWAAGNNPGLLLKASNETVARTLIRFYSADNTNASFRPELVVDYTVPEPTSIAWIGLGAAALVKRRSR